ncbi:DUF2505 domain-containing protein [Hydrocarboniphaga sp.]|uniref:DUF2505 domain-containing protein n=1 Tax=Hydrocarboniphaga sp. TaxID=2033016 RepID=UPI00263886AA|nr:DUF2505 domain-containing protein [Hydrocarboniphaga sp.]
MKFTSELKYPKPVDVVMKMFTDPAYFERKYQALEVSDFAVTQHVAGDSFSLRYRFRAAGETRVPDFARKLIGDAIRVGQVDAWHVSRRVGTIDIEIGGAPASVHADMKLEADSAKTSVLKLDWQVRCGIPLIGGKIEKLIAGDVQRRTAADGQVSIKLLADYA